MWKRALWAASFLFLFGLTAVVEALKLTMGELGKPGPGFFPFYIALGFSMVSLALLVQSLLKKEGGSALTEQLGEGSGRKKVVWALLGLFLYAFALETIGFLLATFFLMLFLFRAVDPLRWPSALWGSLLSSLITYAVFKLWLQVQFPAGPWGL